jgi:hypothetical protein
VEGMEESAAARRNRWRSLHDRAIEGRGARR